MVANNIFRLAMILSSGQAQNFQTNLRKLVKLVLYDNFEIPIKLTQIQAIIEEQYSLAFSDSELLSAIKKYSDDIIINTCTDPVNNTYQLQPEAFKKIQEKQTVNIGEYISMFLASEESEDSWEFETVKELVYKFLYFSFNSDTKTVLELMNRKTSETKSYCVSDEFTPDEAKIINAFLNWNYVPKNEFVLNLISSCFDYCMLTVKKDMSSFSSIFNGKEFYLDSNIIFRLAGFNKVERQVSMDAFIRKCVDSGIKICYTNHTYAETKSTIKYYVDGLKKLLGKKEPLSREAMQALSSKYANLDFHDEYIKWCKIPTSVVGDFDSFRKYLERIVSGLLSPFKLVVADNYDTHSNCKRFTGLCDDFTEYKSKHYKNTYEGAIKVDINNYLYILEKASANDATDFMQLKYYFITADHCLTEWAAIQRPGVVPMFVLPSVWYSILLKYKGRTAEDYVAFCQFLNIRIAPERDTQLAQKRAMLAYIIELNEDHEIKEQIIFDIRERLSDPQVTVEDPIAFVEESHETIIQSRVAEVRAESDARHSKQMKDALDEAEEKHRLEREQDELGNAQKIQSAKEDSFTSGQDDIIKKQAQGIVKRHKGILITFWGIVGLGILIFLATFILSYFVGDKEISIEIIKWLDENSKAIKVISGSGSALFTVIGIILRLTKVLSTNEDYIIKKLNNKYNRK